jgi:EAL domain-containing protein (putative c-di-GMP-specific phosphodiesterase class I)
MLEISERGIGRWDHTHSALADELFGHGIGFAVDDLGTGDAGPAVLGRRHWDWVKLDRGFLANDCPANEVVLRHAAEMLVELGLGGVLEGVETAQQLELAERLGLGLAQGNGLGRPVPAAELLDGVRAAGLRAPCSWR